MTSKRAADAKVSKLGNQTTSIDTIKSALDISAVQCDHFASRKASKPVAREKHQSILATALVKECKLVITESFHAPEMWHESAR